MTRARELSRLGNSNAITANSSNEVGIGTDNPDRQLDVGQLFLDHHLPKVLTTL